jgi:hypothetical protein
MAVGRVRLSPSLSPSLSFWRTAGGALEEGVQ